MLKSYKELKAWQTAYALCLGIYKATDKFPEIERYVLTSQMRRAAVSVPSNTAEGYGRKTLPDYIRSLYLAYGSFCELETQTSISADLGHITADVRGELEKKLFETGLVLKSLIKSLEKKAASGSLKPPVPQTLKPSNVKEAT